MMNLFSTPKIFQDWRMALGSIEDVWPIMRQGLGDMLQVCVCMGRAC